MTTGDRLAAWRLEKGLSQREAAARAKMSQATWHTYENGVQPGIDAATAIEAVTEGQIKVADWRESDRHRAARRAKTLRRRVQRKADKPVKRARRKAA